MAIILGDFFTCRGLEMNKLKLMKNCANSLILSLLMKIMNEFDISSILEVIGLLVNP